MTVEIGMMTLSSSSFRTGSENVAGGGSKGCSMMGADVGVLAGAGEGALVGEVVGLSRGDRRVGWLGISAKPGVLLRVTRPCLRGVVLTTLGAVGLLDNVGSTLGDWASSPTLGGCCWDSR